MRHRGQFAAWLLLVLGTAGSAGGQSSSAPAPALVIDFHAVSADGRFVADLRPEDVTLRVDGRVRAIRSLQRIEIGRPSDEAARSGPLPPPPFGTNVVPADSRTLALVLDDDSFRPGREQPLREAVGRFLPELGARDRVALVTVPYGGVKVDFTTDREKINQALSRIVGQEPADQTGSDLACRTRRTLESLAGLLDSSSGGEGPMTLLFFSSALSGPRRDAEVMRGPGACELTVEDFRRVGTAASAARAHVYVVMPDAVMVRPGTRQVENIAGRGFTGPDNPLEGLEHLAGVTGGQLFDLTAGGDGLTRVARETAGYYLAGFDRESSDRGGSRHQIEVRVTRADVVVRSRREITLARTAGRASRGSVQTPRAMLREANLFRELPLRGIGYASQNPGDGKVKIVTIVEPVDPSVKLAAAAAGLVDAKGQLVAQWTAADNELTAMPVMTALVVPPGIYRLRVAATDASGRRGSADDEVVAELAPAGSLKLSALVLGLSRGGGFVPRLQFGAEPVAIGYVELFGRPQGTVSVTLEVAETINGPAIRRTTGAVTDTSDENRRLATGAIPIGGLHPGDYVVRAIVGVEGQPAGRVMRTLRKVP